MQKHDVGIMAQRPQCQLKSHYNLAHNKNATRPAAMAPILATMVLALLRKGFGVVVVVVVLEPETELLQMLLTSSKLAQASRVVFALWMLIERLPRKLPRPAWVET